MSCLIVVLTDLPVSFLYDAEMTEDTGAMESEDSAWESGEDDVKGMPILIFDQTNLNIFARLVVLLYKLSNLNLK